MNEPSARTYLFTGIALLAMTAAMAVALVPRLSASAAATYQASTYPEAPATYAGHNFPGQRLYTIDTWGGYLAYRFPSGRIVFLYDEPAVFGSKPTIDSTAEVFPAPLVPRIAIASPDPS